MDVVKTILGNEIIVGILVAGIVIAAGYIVRATKTKKDDEIYAMVVHAFNVAEQIIPDKAGPLWMQKVDGALRTFNSEYVKRTGKEPTEAMIQYAQDTWAILANELKAKAA